MNTETTFTVVQKIEAIKNMAQMVITRITPSFLLTGSSGIGKTSIIKSQLDYNRLLEGSDYVICKGHITAMGLYSFFFRNNGKIIVFDDCDKVFDNETSLNVLKGALDSYNKRTISWESTRIPESANLPTKFDFKGVVIFISNRMLETIDDTLKTRTLCVNLVLSHQEILDLMKELMPVMGPEMNLEMKQEVLDYIASTDTIRTNLNLRTFVKALRIREAYRYGEKWKMLTSIMIENEE